jgi:hypothetical protein
MKVMTNFEIGQSTPTQRAFVMVRLVLGQCLGPIIYSVYLLSLLRPSEQRYHFVVLSNFLILALCSPGSIGGMIMVGKTIMHDEVCTRM